MDITAGALLSRKGYEVYIVSPDCSVYDALKVLAEKDIGALLVYESDKLAGIFSERDYARKVVLKGKFSRSTLVKEVMTENVVTVEVDEKVEHCMDIMTGKHVRHLPVLKDGRVVGIISIGDIVKAIISEQESTIRYLENYIVGRR